MARREFSKQVQRDALKRAAGQREGTLDDGARCPCALQVSRYHFDHVIPDANGGRPTLENCQVLCVPCHATKTADDQGDIAKVKRVRDLHLGIKDPHRRPMPGGRFSPLKRKVGGGVVIRATGEPA